MTPNLTTSYMAIQTEREELSARAERGWLVEEAVKSRPYQTRTQQASRWSGRILVALGERLQGPPAVPVSTETSSTEVSVPVASH